MTRRPALLRLPDMCDIYFEGSLISKERIIECYIEFLASSFVLAENSPSIALHTGSDCFEIVALLTAALACVFFDKTDAESVISSLNVDDLVVFRNKRYRWQGLETREGVQCLVLEADGRGKSGPVISWHPFDACKNLIKPYYGPSDSTGGQGIKRQDNNRADFISHMLGVDATEVPSVTGASAVIVAKREAFHRLSKGLSICYDYRKSIELLDIVTASYFSSSGEEYQYGRNPAKTEPVLKVTGNLSTARDLVLERHGNVTAGLIVTGESLTSRDRAELADLLGRKTLKFTHVAAGIDSEYVEDIVEAHSDADFFACTKEFLLLNSLPLQVENDMTIELDRQVEGILNKRVVMEHVDREFPVMDLHKIREALRVIRNSEWEEDAKNSFMISAYSLLNLFNTAIFPMKALELAVERGELRASVASPRQRVSDLWHMAATAGVTEYECAYVADVLERLYEIGLEACSKYDALKRRLEASEGQKIAIVVPKAYYIDLIREDEILHKQNVTMITANRFDSKVRYDEIIVVGEFNGKRFDPFRCQAAADIIVLLYEYETYRFQYKKCKAEELERTLNYRLNIVDELLNAGDDDYEPEELNASVIVDVELEEYINNISFDIEKFAAEISRPAEATLAGEVCAVGKFVSGERIAFSKYYSAVIFDPTKESVVESEVEDITVGDQLLFVNRDDYTQNMVDYIYENLQAGGRLDSRVLDATEKAAYWKEALREYKDNHDFTYGDIAEGLQRLGSSLQEATVRQWLIDESRIVGPRDEVTLQQIAQLTQDPYLLSDPRSYFEACRVVRRQRREILDLIGKAIADKLRGYKPPVGGVLETVFDNVETLSQILELDEFMLLNEPITVPINLINKPIMD